MITVPARRVKQFGVEFYQAALSAKDIDRLVRLVMCREQQPLALRIRIKGLKAIEVA